MITINEPAGMIDHSLLRADAKEKEFEKLCNEADIYGFKMVAVNSYPVALCKQLLRNRPELYPSFSNNSVFLQSISS